MKTLTKYLNERLVIFPSQVDEKLVINKDYKNPYTCAPNTVEKLRKIIENRYNKFGKGTKDNPIDFNDVDVSNIDSFYDNNINIGIFEDLKFEYIDISDWDVSNVKNMVGMFYKCKQLKSIGDISDWDVSNVEDMSVMFYRCEKLTSVGDLSNWDISNVRDISSMFCNCEQLTSVGDLSKWNVSNVMDVGSIFYGCKQLKSVGDLSNWNISNVKNMYNMFKNSGITNIPKWYR